MQIVANITVLIFDFACNVARQRRVGRVRRASKTYSIQYWLSTTITSQAADQLVAHTCHGAFARRYNCNGACCTGVMVHIKFRCLRSAVKRFTYCPTSTAWRAGCRIGCKLPLGKPYSLCIFLCTTRQKTFNVVLLSRSVHCNLYIFHYSFIDPVGSVG